MSEIDYDVSIDYPAEAVPGESTPDTVSTTGVVGPFPLREGDFFGTEAVAPQCHTGSTAADVKWIVLIQEQVGAELTGVYDADTAAQVLSWRENHGMEAVDYVDQRAWEHMMRFEKDVSVEVGEQSFPTVEPE